MTLKNLFEILLYFINLQLVKHKFENSIQNENFVYQYLNRYTKNEVFSKMIKKLDFNIFHVK